MPQMTRYVKLCQVIIVDRTPINTRTLQLVEYLKTGGLVPPIHIQPNGSGQFVVLDGRHRTIAYKLLGRDKILARYGVVV